MSIDLKRWPKSYALSKRFCFLDLYAYRKYGVLQNAKSYVSF